ncbi:hypothetical protein E2C01_025424 [Portunus trituberculatus]|uniref:Uncharacterized protein n=1 Tax=Portunus trituberculatus TaxID=210409 RepID=A0A5B7ECW6_PORTR|nr:hypothetical protein [Portunus trituberculatus]
MMAHRGCCGCSPRLSLHQSFSLVPLLFLVLLCVTGVASDDATQSPAEGGGEGEGGESRVKVFSFQRDTTKAVTEEVFVRYNFSRDPTATIDALTVCYWVR